MTNTTETLIWFQARNLARTEQRLRELASDLAEQVRTGDLTDIEANAWYTMVADRLMTEA